MRGPLTLTVLSMALRLGRPQSFVEYGLAVITATPSDDWKLMTIAEVQGLQSDIAAYYRLNQGFIAFDGDSFASRCLRCEDGALLLDGLELGLNADGSGSGTALSEVSDDGTFYYLVDLADNSRVLSINTTRSFTNESSDTAECFSTGGAPGLWFRQRYAWGDLLNESYWTDLGWSLTTDDELEADREYFDMYYNMYSGLPVIGNYDPGSSCQVYFGADENDAMEARYNETYDFTEYQVCPFRGTTRVSGQVNDGEYLALGLLTISNNYAYLSSDNFASLNDVTRFLMDNSGSTFDDALSFHTLYTRGRTWIGYTWPPTSSPSSMTSAPSSVTTPPTKFPTQMPTSNPTIHPTQVPTTPPTANPTLNPTSVTGDPTTNPTSFPTTPPTKSSSAPTSSPTPIPSALPTTPPTSTPTQPPSVFAAQNDGSGSSNDNTPYIIGGILVGIVLCCIVFGFLALRRRDLDHKNEQIEDLENELARTKRSHVHSAIELAEEEDPMSLDGMVSRTGTGGMGSGPIHTAGYGAAVGAGAAGRDAGVFLTDTPAPPPRQTDGNVLNMLLNSQSQRQFGAGEQAAVQQVIILGGSQRLLGAAGTPASPTQAPLILSGIGGGGAAGFQVLGGGAAASPVIASVTPNGQVIIPSAGVGAGVAAAGVGGAGVAAAAAASPGGEGRGTVAAHGVGESFHREGQKSGVAPDVEVDDDDDEPSVVRAEGGGFVTGVAAAAAPGADIPPPPASDPAGPAFSPNITAGRPDDADLLASPPPTSLASHDSDDLYE